MSESNITALHVLYLKVNPALAESIDMVRIGELVFVRKDGDVAKAKVETTVTNEATEPVETPRQDRHHNGDKARCNQCSKVYTRARKDQRFCSKTCSRNWHNAHHGKPAAVPGKKRGLKPKVKESFGANGATPDAPVGVDLLSLKTFKVNPSPAMMASGD